MTRTESVLAHQFKSCKSLLKFGVLLRCYDYKTASVGRHGGRDHKAITIIVSEQFKKQNLMMYMYVVAEYTSILTVYLFTQCRYGTV